MLKSTLDQTQLMWQACLVDTKVIQVLIIGKQLKKVLCYLQGTKDYMLTYRRTNNLEIIGYSDSNYAGCKDTRKSTSGYIFVIKWTYFMEEP